MAELKEQLAQALKREQELLKLGEKKARMLLAAGERWERKQVRRIQSMVKKKRRKSRA